MNARQSLLAIALALALMPAPKALAEEGKATQPPEAAAASSTSVSADSVELKDGVYHLRGSVRISRDKMTMQSDRATYDEATGQAKAAGNVKVTMSEAELKAEAGEMDLRSGQGALYNGTLVLQQDGFHVTAPEVRILGEGHYTLSSAEITTCTGLPPDWCLRGSDIDVLVGYRISAWNATLSLRGVPAFYTPYVWAPIITERQSGLLPPTFGYRSATGLYYSQPLFWAITENRDATLTLDYMSRRAFGQALEYRYVEGPNSIGEWDLYHLRDSLLQNDYQRINATHTQFYDNFIFRTALEYVNRQDYFRKFEVYMQDSSLRFLESRAEAAYTAPAALGPFKNSRLYLAATYYEDLKQETDQDTILQRTPEAGLSIAPIALMPNTSLAGHMDVVNFTRPEGTEARRASLSAELTNHLSFQGFTASQTLKATDYFYSLTNTTQSPEGESSENLYYAYDTRLGSTLSRQYGEAGSTLTHSIEPYLTYTFLKREGPAPAEHFDSVEELADLSEAGAELITRLRSPRGEYMALKLRQALDLLSGKDKLKPFELSLSAQSYGADPKVNPFTLTGAAFYDHERGKLRSATTTAALKLPPLYLTATQTYDQATPVQTYSLTTGYALTAALTAEAHASYDYLEEQGVEEAGLTLHFKSQCWGLSASYVWKPGDYNITVKASLLGLGGNLEETKK